MINVDKLRKKTMNTEFVACRVDTDTKQWLEGFCAVKSVSVAAVLLELLLAFKREQQTKAINKAT